MVKKFSPKDFIEISKEITGQSQAHCRSVINRAYYAAFGHIKSNLGGFQDTSPSVHINLVNALKRSAFSNQIKAGKRLEGLYKKRIEADYKYNLNFPEGTIEYSIKESEQIIRLFDEEE